MRSIFKLAFLGGVIVIIIMLFFVLSNLPNYIILKKRANFTEGILVKNVTAGYATIVIFKYEVENIKYKGRIDYNLIENKTDTQDNCYIVAYDRVNPKNHVLLFNSPCSHLIKGVEYLSQQIRFKFFMKKTVTKY